HFDGIQAGSYRVVFGGGQWPSRSVSLEVRDRGTTNFSQEFPHGIVNIESSPPGAAISERDTPLGDAPGAIAMPPGSHTLVAEIEGRRSISRTVVVVAGKTESVRFEFKAPGPGKEAPVAHRRRKRKPVAQESELTKIGRTLKSLFFGKPPTKKTNGS
ncbi:MAG TPA: PEGA domain-containing protein, partial [Bryobacteraceae bacterium]